MTVISVQGDNIETLRVKLEAAKPAIQTLLEEYEARDRKDYVAAHEAYTDAYARYLDLPFWRALFTKRPQTPKLQQGDVTAQLAHLALEVDKVIEQCSIADARFAQITLRSNLCINVAAIYLGRVHCAERVLRIAIRNYENCDEN